ncbi:MAG: hypothetical protein EOO41_00415 [Methanobacteriota archaeon]|nr:MAG: hypothetical protein EOO41_00415 [Euryarchaeota archaeon]
MCMCMCQQRAVQGYTLYARDDASFTDDCFKLACRHFPRPLKPHITPAQFLADGFVERKIIFVVEVLRQCIDIHRQAELRAQLTRKAVPPYSRCVTQTCLHCPASAQGCTE